MTPQEETEMHELATTLAQLTEGTGWEMMRYMAIGQVLEQLTRYCATCSEIRPITKVIDTFLKDVRG